MAIFEVNIWTVSKGRIRQHEEVMKRISQYEKANPEKFKEQKSFRYFSCWAGEQSPVGGRVAIYEYETLADMEKIYARLKKDEEFNKMDNEWLSLIEPNSVRRYIWHEKNRDLWTEEHK